ncbi:MAG: hypothetical protein ACYCX8_12345 [Acidimicrobiales bacterium]
MKRSLIKLFLLKSLKLTIGLSFFSVVLTPIYANPELKEKQKLFKLEKEYKISKNLYAQKPGQIHFKKNYLATTLSLADAVMTSTVLLPKIKYPQALRLYREVLSLTPENKSAKKNKDLIEGIYRNMGRPIPKG